MAKILKMENVENFLMDLDAILDEHGIGKADIEIQLGTETERVKVTGKGRFPLAGRSGERYYAT